MIELKLTDKEAHIVNVENDRELNHQTVEWECGGPSDRTTSDFEWPGKIVSSDDGDAVCSGWVILEGSALKIGDVVPLQRNGGKKMEINIIETRDIGNDEFKTREVRLVDIDGVRHLQMMGAEHEAMPYTWRDGLIMVCPETLTLDEVASDPELYYRGFGAGCEVCDDIPQELS